jgi:hypothetical protein
VPGFTPPPGLEGEAMDSGRKSLDVLALSSGVNIISILAIFTHFHRSWVRIPPWYEDFVNTMQYGYVSSHSNMQKYAKI